MDECLNFFRESPILGRLLTGFRDKYLSYGSFSGTVTLRIRTEDEREDLEGFLRKNYHGKKTAAVSAAAFAKALGESRFADVSPAELLEGYFGEALLGKKELKEQEEARWQRLLEDAKADCAGTPGGEWLRRLEEEKDGAYAFFRRRFREEAKNKDGTCPETERLLRLGCRICSALPARGRETEYLAVFAAKLTGNPHAFDDGTREGALLSLLVQDFRRVQGMRTKERAVFPALARQQAFLQAGILRDDLSNYAMLSGVRAKKRGGSFHEGMEGFFREGETVQAPLQVIAGWEALQCVDNTVYIVENPSVYALLCGKWKGKRSLLCTNGQPRLSSLLLLTLFAGAGTTVYYAGDFDPEGLLIAQKLKQYYQGRFLFWHMGAEDYEKSRSDRVIAPHRLKMLERITDPKLSETAKAIRTAQRAGFQENIWKAYLEE